jgi:peptidyl-prolyl cis-trans isomerase B (cyclophilin B)
VIPDFMIQGGGMEPGMKKKPTRSPIKNEATNGLKNKSGTVAMARTSVVDSATGQFFINCKDNSFLDHRDTSSRGYGYAVFGKVVEGMDVVRKIEKVPTGVKEGHRDVPVEDITIVSVEIRKP